MIQFKTWYKDQYASQDLYEIYFPDLFPFIKNLHEPIISIEHFVDIDYLIGNNNETGVGFNCEKKTCRQKNNGVKNSSIPGGTWPWSF